MNKYSDEELIEIEQMSVLMAEMTDEELEQFFQAVELAAEARKRGSIVVSDSSPFLH